LVRASIEIERLLGGRGVRVFFGLSKQLVEFPFKHFVVALLLVKRFLENLAAASFFALQLLDCGANVLDGGWPLVFLVADHDLEFGINLQRGFAARAVDLNQLVLAFTHTEDGSAIAGFYGSGRSGL
jgi:hypothetical protein